MTLTHCADVSAADWLVRSDTPPDQLITFGPSGYQAYARLRYLPDPAYPGQSEADVELPNDHPSSLSIAKDALRILAGCTDTPEQCYFCIWDGIAGSLLTPTVLQGPLVSVPHRRYALYGGAVTDFLDADEGGQNSLWPVPAFVWPADRQWCFTSDVDPHWGAIGSTDAVITRLLQEKELDVVAASPGEPAPLYY